MSPAEIVTAMMAKDAYSQWLGIQILETGAGYAKVQLTVRPEMLNGHGIAHGGITYGLSDSCFAFASNSRGQKAVSIETSISHVAAVQEGDVLTAESSEDSLNPKIGVYHIRVTNQRAETVALFKGMVYRKKEVWTLSPDVSP
ncbi:MAG: hydroxyphenylacetyl-CoA thioesterase PaaI [Bacteroidota bacterium]